MGPTLDGGCPNGIYSLYPGDHTEQPGPAESLPDSCGGWGLRDAGRERERYNFMTNTVELL